MRLLLDEHISPAIARELRSRGHDVVATAERPELRARADRVQFAIAEQERRAVVTRDVGDYRPLLNAITRAGSRSYGLVCISRRFALNRNGIGRLVAALDALIQQYPGDTDLTALGGEVWLVERTPGGP